MSWTSQYTTPSIESLTDDLPQEHRVLYGSVRTGLIEQMGVKAKLEYLGVAWHWCEVLTPKEPCGNLISVRLIPDPQNPRVSVCCSRGFYDQHPPTSLPRGLHTGLSEGIFAGHKAWCSWPVRSEESVTDILEIVRLMMG